ncbi:hypothetical protein ElyMa_005317800 [Elysia marginata]|uniref:Uncharacterized protein n=1 Tax=Elysia marginata TaxID=1093978 RepID=A0AAV4K1S6_9GAST|nr:hypothetical protein ElyMa_005317800 [Elysia marginata]
MRPSVTIAAVVLLLWAIAEAHPHRMRLSDFFDAVRGSAAQDVTTSGSDWRKSLVPSRSYLRRGRSNYRSTPGQSLLERLAKPRGDLRLETYKTYTPARESSWLPVSTHSQRRPSSRYRSSWRRMSENREKRLSRLNDYLKSRKLSRASSESRYAGSRRNLSSLGRSFADFLRRAIYSWLKACRSKLRQPYVTPSPDVTTSLADVTAPDENVPVTIDMGGAPTTQAPFTTPGVKTTTGQTTPSTQSVVVLTTTTATAATTTVSQEQTTFSTPVTTQTSKPSTTTSSAPATTQSEETEDDDDDNENGGTTETSVASTTQQQKSDQTTTTPVPPPTDTTASAAVITDAATTVPTTTAAVTGATSTTAKPTTPEVVTSTAAATIPPIKTVETTTKEVTVPLTTLSSATSTPTSQSPTATTAADLATSTVIVGTAFTTPPATKDSSTSTAVVGVTSTAATPTTTTAATAALTTTATAAATATATSAATATATSAATATATATATSQGIVVTSAATSEPDTTTATQTISWPNSTVKRDMASERLCQYMYTRAMHFYHGPSLCSDGDLVGESPLHNPR